MKRCALIIHSLLRLFKEVKGTSFCRYKQFFCLRRKKKVCTSLKVSQLVKKGVH